MPNASELKNITLQRLKTAETLINAQDWHMATYTMAMCLEIALKALICRTLNLAEYPENHGSKSIKGFFKTHNFTDLAFVSGLNPFFSAQDEVKIFNNWNNFLKKLPGNNWPDIRYMEKIHLEKKDIDAMHKHLLAILKEIKKQW